MKKFLKSFVYAMQGIKSAISDQPNLRVHIAIAIIVIGAGFYVGITSIEWCIMLICIGLVIGMEMINSAIESLVDLVTLERKPLAGKIKDIASGAVLFVSIITLIIGVIIFRKYIVL